MIQVVFNEEWVVDEKLTERTGLSERQIKAYRLSRWIEGIHFKRVPLATEKAAGGLLWYNLPLINEFIRDS